MKWILMQFHDRMSAFGLSENLITIGTVLCGLLLILVADFLLCASASAAARRFLVRKTDGVRHREKAEVAVRRIVRFLFAWLLCAWIPDLFSPDAAAPFARLLNAAAVTLGAAALSALVSWVQSVAHVRTGDKTFSSKAFAQVAKILIWSAAMIVVAATLMGKSPTFVLSGLGALTAVLMLIFRDSILGLVAGVQVAQNDMVRIGDWITMPGQNADGNVIEIALTTVKVQNFDNTVTMIPSSALIGSSFINWRYMSDSKGRRIKRPVWISASSITEVTDEMRIRLVSEGLLKDGDRPVSNLAAFEMWLRRMLQADPEITQELTCMVRQTDAGATGIPVEVYCFTKTRNWEEYERIQTALFDCIFVTVPKFGLSVYERTRDSSAEARTARAM